MKPTQRTDAIRNIFRKIVSYLSIVLIVMLGVGGFFATAFMVKGLETEGEAFYDRHHFKDFEVDSVQGLAPEDIQRLGETEGVEAAEGVQIAEASLTKGERRQSVELISLTQKVSVPEAVQGRFPAKKDECMITQDAAEAAGIGTGDRVKIRISDPRLGDGLLTSEEFTVTGIMVHPEYVRHGMGAAAALPDSSFDREKTGGGYISAFVRIHSQPEASMFSERYFEDTAGMRAKLENVTAQIRQARLEEAEEKADAELARGREKLEDAQTELEEGLEDGKKKLEAAEWELAEKKARGEEELKQAEKELQKVRKELDKGTEELSKKNKELEQAQKEAAEAMKELGGLSPEQVISIIDEELAIADEMEEAIASQDPERIKAAEARAAAFARREDVRKAAGILAVRWGTDPELILLMIESGVPTEEAREEMKKFRDEMQKLEEASGKISEGEKELKKASEKLAAGEKEYSDGFSQLEEGKEKLESEVKKASEKIQAGWNEYYEEKETKEKEIEEGWEKYHEEEEKAEEAIGDTRKIAEASDGYVLVRDRLSNAGYVDFRSNVRAIRSSGLVFGIGFLVLCAMVCFSTLALIIEEQKQLVGTAKAFGLYPGEILKKYLTFGVSAALFGSLLGIPLAVALGNLALTLIERSNLYAITGVRSIVTPVPAAAVVLLAAVLCAAVTAVACKGLLRTPASRLMKGEILKKSRNNGRGPAKPGRIRLPGLHGSLYSRLIMRNMRGDLSRVVLTIAILAGSCFIIGLGFTVRESLTGMLSAQETQILRYDCRVDLGKGVTKQQQAEMEAYLDREGTVWTRATYEPHLYRTEGRVEALYVLSANQDNVEKIYALRDPKTQQKISLPREGILIQNRMHETAGFREGDTMSLYGLDLSPREGTVAGQFQNYEGRLIIMSEEAYREVFGAEPSGGSLFLRFSDKAEEAEILAGLGKISGQIDAEDSDEFAERFQSMIGIFNVVVALMIGIAVLMSFMILLNLTNIFVSRKKKEIIVMRINGFSRKQTDGYLIRETVFMTLAGLVTAFTAGMLTTEPFVRVLEQPDVQSIRMPDPLLWGLGVLIEGCFALLISWIAFRKTRKYQLREIGEI